MTRTTEVERAPVPGQFLVWAAAAALSDAGVAVLYVALGWAASAQGGAAAGLVIATITASRTVLLLVGGTVADRFGPRVVMLVGDAGLFIATAVFALIALVVGAPLWLLFLVAVVEGVVSAFYIPASSSLPRRLVKDDAVARASALRGVSGELAELLGGPLGGLLVAAGGFALAAGVDVLTYLPIFLVMLWLRPSPGSEAPPQETQHWRKDLVAGVALVAADPLLRTCLALIAVVAAVFVPVGAVLVPLLVRYRGWSPDANGLLLGALTAGGLLVGLVISRTGAARVVAPAASAGLLGTAGGLALLATTLPFPFLIASAACAGAGIAVFTGHVIPLVLQHAPETHLSRVLSVLSVVQAVALIASAPALGSISSVLSPSAALLGCACVLAAATAVAAASPAWRTARQQAD